MRSARRSMLSLLAAVLCTALAYTLIVNGLRNPVVGPTVSFQASFNDVSGVRPGVDIRRQGVQVGKVNTIRVVRAGDHNVAEVGLEIRRDQHVTTATHLAVKFQNLTGARYIDISDRNVANPQPVSRIPLEQTTGSFDLTQLFAGLAPVLRTLEPGDINDLTEKLSIFLDGDGAGAADLLNSVRIIADRASDRQQSIRTLIENMSVFARKVQGRSAQLVQILSSAKDAVDTVMKTQHLFRELAEHGPNFFASVNRLLWQLGLRTEGNLDAKFDVLRANLYRVPEFLERLPGAYPGMQPLLKNPGLDTNCANGQLAIPPMVKVFLTDQEVVLCNR